MGILVFFFEQREGDLYVVGTEFGGAWTRSVRVSSVFSVEMCCRLLVLLYRVHLLGGSRA